MSSANEAWEKRLAELWASLDDHKPDAFVAQINALVAEALVDLGREREAVAHGLIALSRYLPRYNRSLARYAEAIAPSNAL